MAMQQARQSSHCSLENSCALEFRVAVIKTTSLLLFTLQALGFTIHLTWVRVSLQIHLLLLKQTNEVFVNYLAGTKIILECLLKYADGLILIFRAQSAFHRALKLLNKLPISKSSGRRRRMMDAGTYPKTRRPFVAGITKQDHIFNNRDG